MSSDQRGDDTLSWPGLVTFAVLVAGVAGTAIGIFFPTGGHPSLVQPPALQSSSIELSDLCAHPGVADHQWRYIVVHHSATTGGGAYAFERYHVGVREWDSLAYHLVIGNGTLTGDGEIEVGPRWREQKGGPSTGIAEYNEWGIEICLVGDFSDGRPSEPQMRSLHALVSHLMARYGIAADNVLGHGECPGAATECPGRNLPMAQLRESLR